VYMPPTHSSCKLMTFMTGPKSFTDDGSHLFLTSWEKDEQPWRQYFKDPTIYKSYLHPNFDHCTIFRLQAGICLNGDLLNCYFQLFPRHRLAPSKRMIILSTIFYTSMVKNDAGNARHRAATGHLCKALVS
jgi:hypothetical protein